MAVRDVNVDWLRKHFVVPASYAPWALALSEGTPNTFTQLNCGNGTPVWTPNINSLGVAGWLIDTDEDEVVFGAIHLPFDLDPDFAVNVSLHCLTKTNTGSVITWEGYINNVKSAAATALPTTALDTQFSAVTAPGTAYRAYKVTGGQIAASKWTRAEIEASHFINFSAKCKSHAGTIGTESIYLMGVEFSYVPLRTRGSGARSDFDAA